MIVLLKLIKTTVLDATTASVTIDNIPQQYKSLVLLCSVRTDRSGQIADIIYVKPNNSTSNGSGRYLYGNGSAALSATSTDLSRTGVSTGNSATASTFANVEIVFPNYNSSSNKPISAFSVAENNATDSFIEFDANLWSNSAAITSLVIASGTSSNLVAGSTFYLYGVA